MIIEVIALSSILIGFGTGVLVGRKNKATVQYIVQEVESIEQLVAKALSKDIPNIALSKDIPSIVKLDPALVGLIPPPIPVTGPFTVPTGATTYTYPPKT